MIEFVKGIMLIFWKLLLPLSLKMEGTAPGPHLVLYMATLKNCLFALWERSESGTPVPPYRLGVSETVWL